MTRAKLSSLTLDDIYFLVDECALRIDLLSLWTFASAVKLVQLICKLFLAVLEFFVQAIHVIKFRRWKSSAVPCLQIVGDSGLPKNQWNLIADIFKGCGVDLTCQGLRCAEQTSSL